MGRPHHSIISCTNGCADSKRLTARVAHEFSEAGRGFKMGRGGSTQKKFLCSGRASDGGGCQSEVRATMGRKSREWRISYVDLQHANCSGGVAKATGATLAPFAAEAMANNPNMNSVELGRLYKKHVGLQSKPRTVRRHKKDALDAIHVLVQDGHALTLVEGVLAAANSQEFTVCDGYTQQCEGSAAKQTSTSARTLLPLRETLGDRQGTRVQEFNPNCTCAAVPHTKGSALFLRQTTHATCYMNPANATQTEVMCHG